jgi:putative hemolysin
MLKNETLTESLNFCIFVPSEQLIYPNKLNMAEAMEPVGIQLIDVEKVIGNKNPRLLKIIPSFLIHYLKRIIHQDELNDALRKYGHTTGKEFVANALQELKTRYQVIGGENIPRSGRYIFFSNHPLGGLDGIVFIHEIGKYFPEVKFIVNDLLMNVKNMDPVFVPVNKHGRQNADYAKRIEEAYASDAQILYFPAGLCSRKKKGKIEDIPWRKNFLAKAIHHKRDLVPAHFSGRNSSFFYNLANLRVKLGIKSNIEMVYLVDEMFKQKDKEIILRIGKPIPYTTFDNRHDLQEWTDLLKKYVYSLPGSLDHPFLPDENSSTVNEAV